MLVGIRVLSIIVLVIVVFFLMYPISFYVPNILQKWFKRDKKRIKITLDLAVVPVIGVLFLLACGAIDWDEIRYGIVGDDNLQPYAIVILFFALAYLCLSLDITGIFDYIALKAIMSSNGSGSGLFVTVFLLSTLLTIFTSNDIVILTLTQIILSLARFTKSDPLPFLILEFYMANIWSATLFIGNPTNIIVAQAYRLTFLEYSKWMILPTFFAGISAFFIIWLRFRTDIPLVVKVPELDPASFLRDTMGGIFGSICLLCCVVLLLVSSWIPDFPIWAITVTFAGLSFLHDVIYDFFKGRTIRYRDIFVSFDNEAPPTDSSPTIPENENPPVNPILSPQSPQLSSQQIQSPVDTQVVSLDRHKDSGHSSLVDSSTDSSDISLDPISDVESATDPNIPSPDGAELTQNNNDHEAEKKLRREKKANSMNYVTLTVLSRLPWKIIPFVISVFIIVEALSVANWTSDISEGLNALISSPLSNNTNAAISSFVFCTLSSLCCNILNNQPMTILFTRVIQDQNFTTIERPHQGAMYGLILGSNFGANLTLVGALAGIMWAEILKQKGYKLGFFKFAFLGFTTMPVVIAISSAVLAAELVFF